jgi:hypothetical protein
MARFAGYLQPSFHSHAQFRDRFFRGSTESGTRLQARRIGNLGAVFLRPEYDDGVTVHGSVFEFQTKLSYYIPKLPNLIQLCIFSDRLNIDGARYVGM